MEVTNLNLQYAVNTGITKGLEFLNIYKINILGISSVIMAILFSLCLICILLWLLKSVGLYTMAKKNRDEYAFLAFIPYANLYTRGKIIGKTKLFGIEVEHPEILLPILFICMMLPFTKLLTSVLFVFFYFAILYKIYQKQMPNFAIAGLILTIFLPILEPFFLFFSRKSRNGNTVKS